MKAHLCRHMVSGKSKKASFTSLKSQSCQVWFMKLLETHERGCDTLTEALVVK